MGIYIFDIYRNPNIGIFARANDKYLILPQGYAKSKAERLASLIDSKPVFASIGYTRLLGPLSILNSKGILVSRFASDEEIINLQNQTGLGVQRFNSNYSSVGNLVSANDYGAVASPLLDDKDIQQVEEVLKVPVRRTSIAGMKQVGAILIATNKGSLVHPKANEEEIQLISETLKVNCEPGSVNGGIPYVTSGLIVNSKGAIVGSQTVGPEMFVITKAFKL